MKKYYKPFNLILLVLFVFTLIGCSKEDNIEVDLIGQWHVVENDGEEITPFDPFYYHFLTFSEDNTFKMQSFYFHPNQDFDYKRGWFPRISDRWLSLMLKENLVGTYTYEDNLIKLYDKNQEPYPRDMTFELIGNQIHRVTETDYARFIYEKYDVLSMKEDLQGSWILDQNSTNTLSGESVNVPGAIKLNIHDDYISFYQQFSSFPNLTVKFFAGENSFLILEELENRDDVTGYIVGNVLHIKIHQSLHLVYKRDTNS